MAVIDEVRGPRGTVTFTITGPIAPGDLPGLCRRVSDALADADGGEALCDVATVPADVITVDALARLQLAARRHGCRIRLRNASAELLDLVTFLGLGDILTA